MPELPEVEAARQSIDEHFSGKRIVRVHAFQDDKVMEGVNAVQLEALLSGRLLLNPKRKGKHLWLHMEGTEQPMPIFHLGMAGAFEIRGASVVKYKRASKASDVWPPKWCKVAMEFECGGALAFVDSRRFGKIRIAPQPEKCVPISDLGLDALYELPKAEDLASLLGKSQRAIKAVLLDQAVLCGIGNWVADEVLFQARIHPESKAASLAAEDYSRLHSTMSQVLKLAVSVRADSALFPSDWLFHVRWNKKPGSIAGHKITFLTVGGRTSALVPALQQIAKGSILKTDSTANGSPSETGNLGIGGNTAAKPGTGRKGSKADGNGSGKGKKRKAVGELDEGEDKQSVVAVPGKRRKVEEIDETEHKGGVEGEAVSATNEEDCTQNQRKSQKQRQSQSETEGQSEAKSESEECVDSESTESGFPRRLDLRPRVKSVSVKSVSAKAASVQSVRLRGKVKVSLAGRKGSAARKMIKGRKPALSTIKEEGGDHTEFDEYLHTSSNQDALQQTAPELRKRGNASDGLEGTKVMGKRSTRGRTKD